MKATIPTNVKEFRAAAARLRSFHEMRPIWDWLEQRRVAFSAELIRCNDPTDVPRLQGRVRELEEIIAEFSKNEE